MTIQTDLLEKAGFVIEDNQIDWSSDYSLEIEAYTKLVLLQAIEVMKKHDYHGEWLGEKIIEHFKIV